MSADLIHMVPARVADDPPKARNELALTIIAAASGLLENHDAAAAQVASMFCAMTDDAQSQFFTHVARIYAAWGKNAEQDQLLYIGRHLRTCECSTEEARQWLRDLVAFMDDKP